MALTLKQALAMFWEQIQVRFVKREDGKGLSTNDFTMEEKNKLASLENTTVDTTLTIEGAAADAKVVGEALAGKQPIGEYALKDDIVQPDWNQNDENAPDYVKNRTHYVVSENVSCVMNQDFFLSFNGERFTVTTQGDDGNPATLDFCRISDKTPSQESFEKAHIVVTDSSGETIYNIENFELSNSIGEDYVYHITYRRGGYTSSFPIACFQTAGTKVGLFEDSSSVNVPAPGVYVPPTVSVAMVKDVVTIDFESETYKKLDPKFLPDTVVMAERPEIGGEVVILPETELAPHEVDGQVVGFIGNPTLSAYPEIGKIYTVTVDGVPYELEAQLLDGAAGFVPPDETFAILIVPPESVEQLGFSVGVEWQSEEIPESVTLSIVQTKEVIPQQLVMDTDGNIKWEDRTHYDEIIPDVAIWADDAPELMFSENGMSLFRSLIVPTHSLINGQEYTVIVNGVEYVRSCTYMQDGSSGCYLLGNVDLMMETGNNGDPFVIMLLPPELFNPNDPVGAAVYDLSGALDGTGVSATAVTASVSGPAIVIHKIDEKYLPDSALKTTPQSDWNAANGVDGHVLNRTHWFDPEGTVLWDYDLSLAAGSTSSGGGSYNHAQIAIAPNSTYLVKWGDTEYTCVAKVGTNMTSYVNFIYYIGNGSAYHGGEDTGEPFCIATYADGSQIMYKSYSNTPAISHVTVMVGPGGAYHQLDDRFVNFSKIKVATPNWEANEGEDGYIENRTHYIADEIEADRHLRPLTTIDAGADGVSYVYTNPISLNFIDGCTYEITWDNAKHKYVASVQEDGLTILRYNYNLIQYIPTGRSLDDGTTYYLSVYNFIGSPAKTIELIIHAGAVTKTIDPIYLPEINSNILNGATEGSIKSRRTNEPPTNPLGYYSFSFGNFDARATGPFASALGASSTARGSCSHAEGNGGNAIGEFSHAENFYTKAEGANTHAEGYITVARGDNSHSEGKGTYAIGDNSHSEGVYSYALGNASHSEGSESTSIGANAHSEGSTIAFGATSHSENTSGRFDVWLVGGTDEAPCEYTLAYPDSTPPEMFFIGQYVAVKKGLLYTPPKEIPIDDTHSYWTFGEYNESKYARIVSIQGNVLTFDQTIGTRGSSHIECVAYRGGAFGANSHTEGVGTYANTDNQHVQGKYNVIDEANTYAHILGNGRVEKIYQTAEDGTIDYRKPKYDATLRSNAHTVAWDGTGWFAGDVKVGGTGQDDEAAQKLATESYVDSKIPTPEDALALMIEMGFVDPVVDENGATYTDENNNFFTY